MQCIKVYLAAAYMFEEEYQLTLPQSYIDDIEEKLAELVIGDGDGSKAALNAILAEYGVNYNMLREAYLMDAKVQYLQEYLYGSDLSKVSDQLKQQYYEENYVRFKQVLIPKYQYVYETDENGSVIYFEPGEESETGKILYDKSTGIRKFDDKGNALTDKDGSVIYYNEDGTIAYDKENGVPAYTYDENGNFKMEECSSSELIKRKTTAEDIAEFTEKGDFDTFEKYIKENSDDVDLQANSPNGVYLAVNAQYSYDYIVDIITELCRMDVGEVRMVDSDSGYHVIMKYELDDGAYAQSTNADWFSSFSSDVMQWLFEERCAQYLDDIKVNEAALAERDMRSVSPNYYY